MKKTHLLLLLIIFIGLLFRFFNVFELAPFFGDQAWFYLSARDALLSGRFPLLGITASITWLHQGALFTYLLIPGLVFSGFNPHSGVILMSGMSLVNIVLLFYLGTLVFSRKVGLLSALIFAVSPLVVIYSRTAYHTSAIPLFMTLTTLLLVKKFTFLSGLFLGFLYSLHLLTLVFWLPVFFVVLQRKLPPWKFFTGFSISLMPFLLSGPVATGGIFVWLGYKLFTGFPATNSLSFYLDLFTKFFSPNLLSLLGKITPGPGSDAYFTLLLVPLSLSLGWLLSHLPKYLLLPLSLALIVSNWVYLAHARSGFYLPDRIQVSQQILATSQTVFPNISVTGPGSEYETTADTYRYLVWWLGKTHPPAGKNFKFVVDESNLGMRVIE